MDGMIILAMSIAFFYLAYRFRKNIKNIAKNGELVEGIVFDIVEDTNPQSQAKYPIIRFVTSKKEWITEPYNISTFPGFFKKDQKINIVYNPDNPKEFFVKSAITSIAPIILSILATILLAIGIYKVLHV